MGQHEGRVIGEGELAGIRADAGEGEGAGGGLGQVARTGQRPDEGEVAATLIEREGLARRRADGEVLVEGERGGAGGEAEGRARDRVEVGARAERRGLLDDQRGVGVGDGDGTGEGVGAAEDQGAVAGVGQVTAGEGRAAAGGGRDGAGDGQGRARGRSEGTAGVAVEGEAAVGGERQVGRRDEGTVGGQGQRRWVGRDEVGAEGGFGRDGELTTVDGDGAGVGRARGEAGLAGAEEGHVGRASQRRGQGQVAATVGDRADATEGEDLVGGEGHAREVEGEGAAIERDIAAGESRRGVEAEGAAVDNEAGGGSRRTGQGQGAVGDDGGAGVGVRAGEDQDARTGLGEAARTGEHAGERQGLARSEVVDAEGRIGGEGEVARVAGGGRLGRGEHDPEGAQVIEFEAGVIRGDGADSAGLEAEAVVDAVDHTHATDALVEAQVEVVPAGGRRGEGTRRQAVPGRVVDQGRAIDLE